MSELSESGDVQKADGKPFMPQSSPVTATAKSNSKQNDLLSDFMKLKKELKTVKNENETLKTKLKVLEEQLQNSPKIHGKKINSDNSDNDTSDSENDDNDEVDLSTKINNFFRQLVGHNAKKKINKHDFVLHIVNTLMTLYHTTYSSEEFDITAYKSAKNSSNKVAQNNTKITNITVYYILEFFKQLSNPLLYTDNEEPSEIESHFNSYPVNWLLGMFPFVEKSSVSGGKSEKNNENNHKNGVLETFESAQVYLPLHFMLAIDTSNIAYSDYLSDLELVLKHSGGRCFDEEVSPLNVVLARKHPSIEVVELLVKYQGDNNICAQEDDDGSLPLMHACGANEGTDVIQFIYEQYPDAIHKGDHFGCAAIHYAAFSGYSATVEGLLEIYPQCVAMTEGNGALPLHDAVQNKRLAQKNDDYAISQDIIAMIELLLAAHPTSIQLRDDFGALPLHKAAKCANLEVVRLIYEAYPRAIFAIDNEGLLPMHYYSQRDNKNLNLEVVQFILQHNPHSKMLDEAQLKAYKEPSATPPPADTTTGTWRDKIKSVWSSATKSTTATAANSSVGGKNSAVGGGNAAGGKQSRRKSSVMNKNALHMQYKK